MSVFECPVSHFEIEILLIFLIWNRKGSWNVHFLLGEYLEYLACERLSSSYISIRLLIGRVSREIQNNPTIKSTYTVITITTEFVRLLLFISREKVIVASRNVGISAKYVIKIYAFGSAHVKFSVWVTASLSAVVFPSEPIQFWMLIETSTPIDPHEINLYWIWFGLCEIRLLNQAKSNIDVLRKSVRFFIKKIFFSGKWPISWKASSEENETGQYPVWMTQKPRELKSKKNSRGSVPPDPPRKLPLWRSFRKSVSIYPRIRSWDL